MDEQYDIGDLTANELAELLADDGANVSPPQAAALRQFIADIGGMENALLAIEMLQQLKRAA